MRTPTASSSSTWAVSGAGVHALRPHGERPAGAEYQRGAWFDVWNFQRGLTSSLFLLLSGFAFSVATEPALGAHISVLAGGFQARRRFGLFLLLGYAIHFPVPRFSMLTMLTDEQWRSFFQVDVLQLIGATFLIVQALVLSSRSRRMFTVAAFVLAGAVLALTHAVWAIDWWQLLASVACGVPVSRTGIAVSAVSVGDICPVWGGLGTNLRRWGAARLRRFATLALFVPGVVLSASAGGSPQVETRRGAGRVELHADPAGDPYRRLPDHPGRPLREQASV